MTEQKHFLSAQKLEELKQELEDLKGPMRKDVAEQLAAAIQMGDLSENAAYDDAKDRQMDIERKIGELEEIIANAEIISETSNTSDINIGSSFKVKGPAGEQVFSIVGSQEAAPLEGKISNESPLGSAFLGKTKGDVVEVEVPKGTIEYKIIKIL